MNPSYVIKDQKRDGITFFRGEVNTLITRNGKSVLWMSSFSANTEEMSLFYDE
jgi:hypothetical protein